MLEISDSFGDSGHQRRQGHGHGPSSEHRTQTSISSATSFILRSDHASGVELLVLCFLYLYPIHSFIGVKPTYY